MSCTGMLSVTQSSRRSSMSNPAVLRIENKSIPKSVNHPIPKDRPSVMESGRQLLGSWIRVRVSDGRIIEGELQCLDKDLNLVVGSAIEYHGLVSDTDASELCSTSRTVGTVVVPGVHLTGVYRKA